MPKTRVLVLGCRGMLGHMVFNELKRSGFRVTGADRKRGKGWLYFDACAGRQTLAALLTKTHPCFIVNCIGITANRIREDDPASLAMAVHVNGVFPHMLADAAGQAGARVIQISTDGVFSGGPGTLFENSTPDCHDNYGKSKLQGEVETENFLNIRCSIVGPSPYEKGGLCEWLAAQPPGAVVRGFTDHVWNGVTTLQFARLCSRLASGTFFQRIREQGPVVHFSPNLPLTKFRLLSLLAALPGNGVKVVPAKAPSGPVRRVLGTGNSVMKRFCSPRRPFTYALKAMASLMKKKG